LLLYLWARRGSWSQAYIAGLARGGWLTAGLVVLLLLIVFLSFGVFFVAFHNVFFEPGTWIFNYSDTLIRLFPERFWRDIFIYVGLLSLGGGLALGLGLRRHI
jgi:integral membrane protein (TIGR01906 family)